MSIPPTVVAARALIIVCVDRISMQTRRHDCVSISDTKSAIIVISSDSDSRQELSNLGDFTTFR